MRKIKRFLSAVLVWMMVLVPAASASAGSGVILITGVASANHTFRAYQLFAGDAFEDKLSNVTWGSGVDGDGLLTALRADGFLGDYFTDCVNADQAAEVLSDNGENSEFLICFNSIAAQHVTTPEAEASSGSADGTSYTYRLSSLPDGYYIVTDSGAETDDANSLYMTRLLNGDTVSIAVKAVYPTVEKTIAEGSSEKGTSASAGEVITFELTGTIPEDLSGYEEYAYIFHDVMSSNLTFAEPLALSVTATKGTPEFEYEASGQDLTVTVSNAKDLAGSIVSVKYDAVLLADAEPGVAEENTVYLEYTHDPNTDEHGRTTEHKVYVYEFDLTVYKEDARGEALQGAGFTLYKRDAEGNWQEVKKYEAGDDTEFRFEDLGEGSYKLAETTTPDGYNTIEDIEFQILAAYNVDGTISSLTTDHPDISVNGATGFSATVVNKAGAVLPKFGGSGVFLFYLGGALLIAAAVLLMKKSRRNRVEEGK